MTALEKMRQWIGTFPGYGILTNGFRVDYTDQLPANGGAFPPGLVEVRRTQDVMGGTTVENQYHFGLYAVLEPPAGGDGGAAADAAWVTEFREWVQAQSVRGQAPAFGDNPKTEKISVQNGTRGEADAAGAAMYVILLSVQFQKHYER